MRESINFFAATDVGRQRDHNEDNYLVDKKLNLFIVADGMGGHAAGEIASGIAVRVVRDTIARSRNLIDDFRGGAAGVSRKSILVLLEHSVQTACSEIHEEGAKDPAKRGMGTTLSVLLVVGNRGFIAHVGDCRIYLLRQGRVHQLTEDHSLINELIKRGRLSKDEIDKVEFKNAVTRAVGVYESVDVDTLDFDVLPGDQFLMASDGLHGYLQEQEIPSILGQEPERVTHDLIQLANDRGGKDNITSVIVQLADVEGSPDQVQEVNLKIETLQKMPLFRFLTYQELVRFMNITELRPYKASDPVIREGEPGEELFVVLTGKMRVHRGDANLTQLGPGDHFGEMAMVDKTPRSASVTAVEDSKVIVIHRRDFFAVIRKEHDLAVKLLWAFMQVLTNRLRQTSRELGEAREALKADDLTDEIFPDLEES